MPFDLDGALQAGYSVDQVNDYLSKKHGFDVSGARKAGHSEDSINDHLMGKESAAPPPSQKRTALEDIVNTVPRAAGSLLTTMGKAGQAFTGGSQGDNSISTKVRGWGENLEHGYAISDENRAAHPVLSTITGAIEGAAPVAVQMGAGALSGAAGGALSGSVAGPWGTAIGGAAGLVGGALAGAGLFGGSRYQTDYELARANGMSPEEARGKAMIPATVEGAGMAAMGGASAAGRGLLKGVLPSLSKPVAGDLLGTGARSFANKVAETAIVDTPVMMGMGYATGKAEELTGIRPDANPMQEAVGGFWDSLAAATIFGLTHAGVSRHETLSAASKLKDPNLSAKDKAKLFSKIHSTIAENDPNSYTNAEGDFFSPAADQFANYAADMMERGKGIDAANQNAYHNVPIGKTEAATPGFEGMTRYGADYVSYLNALKAGYRPLSHPMDGEFAGPVRPDGMKPDQDLLSGRGPLGTMAAEEQVGTGRTHTINEDPGGYNPDNWFRSAPDQQPGAGVYPTSSDAGPQGVMRKAEGQNLVNMLSVLAESRSNELAAKSVLGADGHPTYDRDMLRPDGSVEIPGRELSPSHKALMEEESGVRPEAPWERPLPDPGARGALDVARPDALNPWEHLAGRLSEMERRGATADEIALVGKAMREEIARNGQQRELYTGEASTGAGEIVPVEGYRPKSELPPELTAPIAPKEKVVAGKPVTPAEAVATPVAEKPGKPKRANKKKAEASKPEPVKPEAAESAPLEDMTPGQLRDHMRQKFGASDKLEKAMSGKKAQELIDLHNGLAAGDKLATDAQREKRAEHLDNISELESGLAKAKDSLKKAQHRHDFIEKDLADAKKAAKGGDDTHDIAGIERRLADAKRIVDNEQSRVDDATMALEGGKDEKGRKVKGEREELANLEKKARFSVDAESKPEAEKPVGDRAEHHRAVAKVFKDIATTKAMKDVLARSGIRNVTVAHSEEDVPDTFKEGGRLIKRRESDRPAGVYKDGQIVLISENIKDMRHAMDTLAHEVFHRGFSRVFGNRMDFVNDRVYKTFKPEIDAFAKELGVKNRNEAIDEWLAKKSEGMEQVPAVKMWLARAKELLRGIGLKVGMSDSDVRAMIQESIDAGKLSDKSNGVDKTDTGSRIKPNEGIGRGGNIEVAPNTNPEVHALWKKLSPESQYRVTKSISGEVLPKIAKKLGVDIKLVHTDGWYGKDKSPSVIVRVGDSVKFEDYRRFMEEAGYILDQEAVIAFDAYDTKNGNQAYHVAIQGENLSALYDHLNKTNPEMFQGATRYGDRLVVGNFAMNEDFSANKYKDGEFLAQLHKAVHDFGGDYVADPFKFRSEYIETKEAPNGLDNKINERGVVSPEHGPGWRDTLKAETRARTEELVRGEPGSGPDGIRYSTIHGSDGSRVQGTDERGFPIGEDGRYRLTHWGKVGGLDALDPAAHGTGISGAESKRKKNDPANWVDRTYFGLTDGERGYRKESGLGPHRYETSVDPSRLYDFAKDPDGLKAQSMDWGQFSYSKYEKLIKEAGYDGYVVDHPQLGHVAAMFGKTEPHSYTNEATGEVGYERRVKSNTSVASEDQIGKGTEGDDAQRASRKSVESSDAGHKEVSGDQAERTSGGMDGTGQGSLSTGDGRRFSIAPPKDSPEFKQWTRGLPIVSPKMLPALTRAEDHAAALDKLGPGVYPLIHATFYDFSVFDPRKGDNAADKNGNHPFFFTPSSKWGAEFKEMEHLPKEVADWVEANNPKTDADWKRMQEDTGYGWFPHNQMLAYVKTEKPFRYWNESDIKELESQLVADKEWVRLPADMKAEILKGNWQTLEQKEIQTALRNAGFDGFFLNETVAPVRQINDKTKFQVNFASFKPDNIKAMVGNVGSYGQRPVTEAEAANLGMTAARANELQAKGDIRFSTVSQRKGNNLQVDISTILREHPDMARKNAEAIRGYTGFRSKPDESPEQTIVRLKKHLSDNLQWLYKQIPESERESARKWYEGANRISKEWAKEYGISDSQSAGIIATLSPQLEWSQNLHLAKKVMDIMAKNQDTPWSQSMAKFVPEEYLNSVSGKKLSELADPFEKAIWIRAFDESRGKSEVVNYGPSGDATGGSGKYTSWFAGAPTIAKAINIFEGHDISENLSSAHKVRNFYNNIFNPSDESSVTIDTHAVAAAFLAPFGSSAKEVSHNFGASPFKGSEKPGSAKGAMGTYYIAADAYRDAAKKLGVLPRELQSVVWEKIRSVFDKNLKRSNRAQDIYNMWSDYAKGKSKLDTVRGWIADKFIGPTDSVYDQKGNTADQGKLHQAELAGDDRGEAVSVSGADGGDSGGAAAGVRYSTSQYDHLKNEVKSAFVDTSNLISETSDSIKRMVNAAGRGDEAKLSAETIREHNSLRAQYMDRLEKQYEEARKLIDKLPGDMTDPNGIKAKFVEAIQTGNINSLPADMRGIAKDMVKTNDELLAKVQERGKLLGVKGSEERGQQDDGSFINYYFPGLWAKDSQEAAMKMLSEVVSSGSPLEGKGNFLKKKTYQLFRDGLAAGLKPLYDNPVDMLHHNASQTARWVMSQDIISSMKESGLMKFVPAGYKEPTGWKRVDDPAFSVWAPAEEGGFRSVGNYFMPEGAATVVGNFVSKGLRGKAAFRAYLGAANTMNQLQLGFSAFHLGFTSMDAMVSQFATGVHYLTNGQFGNAAKAFAETPGAALTNAMLGKKLVKSWDGMGSPLEYKGHDLSSLYALGGGRARMDNFYRIGLIPKFQQAFRQGNYVAAALKAPFAGIEMLSKPIMEHVVPWQKAGVFAKLAMMEIDKNPKMSHEELRSRMASIVDSVDNRMGQLVYDNLFWDKAFKDLSMATVRSVGWNLGTWREIGGGLRDLGRQAGKMAKGEKAEMTTRMAYIVALPTLVGLMGAITQYLFTGKGPDELEDYFFPRTGKMDERGNPERLAIPSYIKDLYHMSEEPGKTMTNKIHPMLSTVADMFHNKDYFGNKIYGEDDPAMEKVMALTKFAGKNAIPFAIQGMMKEDERGGSLLDKTLPFIGLTPAPNSLNMSKAEKLMARYAQQNEKAYGREPEMAQKMELNRAITQAARKGDGDKLSEAASKAVASGQMSMKDVMKKIKEANQPAGNLRFNKLDLGQAAKVMAVATEEEKAQFGPLFFRKIRSKSGQEALQRRPALLDELT